MGLRRRWAAFWPPMDDAERAEFGVLQAAVVVARFRLGMPVALLICVGVALAGLLDPDGTAGREQVLAATMSVVALLAAGLLLRAPWLAARPATVIIVMATIVAADIGIIAIGTGGYSSVSTALLLSTWIFGSVVAPLPWRQLIFGIACQLAAYIAVVELRAVDPGARLNFAIVALSGATLCVVGQLLSDRAAALRFITERQLDVATQQLAEQQAELVALNGALEARVMEQVAEITLRSREIEALNVQLQQKVVERSRELAEALARVEGSGATVRGLLAEGVIVGGRARIVRLLGAGGMGSVYLAEDLLTGGRPVAVKAMHRRAAGGAASMRRFLREAMAAAKVVHPAVMRPLLVDVAEDGLVFQISEYAEGEPLDAWLRRRGKLPLGECIALAMVAADALAAAHAAQVVHRDIKPGNLLLCLAEPRLRVLDFGLSRIVTPADSDARLTAADEMLGTPVYMSPEQVRDPEQVGAATDIYSLGIVIFEMVTGSLPYVVSHPSELFAAHLGSAPRHLREVAPHVPPELADVVAACLDKVAERRPAAAELRDRLQVIGDDVVQRGQEITAADWAGPTVAAENKRF